MIKTLIAITLLLIVAIVRLAMSCYRKARDVDYWREATQNQRQENSEANVIATSQGYSTRALTSFLANRRVFTKIHAGKYQKVRHG